MLFIGSMSNAVAADAAEKPTFDLAISKVVAQCRGLLPSKKISCIKEKAKELVGNSVDECTAKPLGEKIPCLESRLKEEAGKLEGMLWVLHLLYQGMHGRDADNSVLGDIAQMARIKANPLVLLEDKELLAGLKKDLQQELGEMKGTDEDGSCRKDASLVGLLNCFKDKYLPQVAVKETLSWMAYAKIFALYIADRNEVGKQLIDLHAELDQAANNPQKLKDPEYRKELVQSAQEVRQRAVANADFWRAHSKELLSGLDRIAIAGQATNAASGSDSDSLFNFELPDGWDETFGPGGTMDQAFGPGSSWDTEGSDWDKTFGPGGTMDQAFGPDSDWDDTFGRGGTMEQANKELARAGRDLKKLNESLDPWVRDMEKTRQSISASMKSLDRGMDRLQEDLAEMDRIGHRKHEARNPLEGLDLSGIGDYVRGGPKSQDDKAKQAVASLLLDFTPGVGDAKGIVEALSGKDIATGQKLSATDRALGGVIVLRWAKAGKKAIKAEDLFEAIKKEKRAKKPKCFECFLAGTKVLMADYSTKNIETVKAGDSVIATDPVSGETGRRTVTHLIVTEHDKHFDDLTISTRSGDQHLTATNEHPFWSPSQKTWVKAAHLRPGMTLRTVDGSAVSVKRNRAFASSARTYNLTVAGLHTYYVLAGKTPVLVHNSNCGFRIGVADEKYDKHVLGLDDSGKPTRRPDMPEYDTDDGFERYVADAQALMRPGSCPAAAREAVRSDGVIIRMDSQGRIGMRNGNAITTYFRPDDPLAYFQREAAR